MDKIRPNLNILFVCLVVAINLFFGLPRIANFSAIDEHLWTYDRTPQFWNAIETHNWKKTNVNDKPGITAAAISGIGLLFINPLDYKDIIQKQKTEEQIWDIRKINFSFRLPIYLFTLLMAPVFFLLLKKLFNETVAALAVGMIYLSPIILGISLFVNPDSLLWIFSSLSIISFLILQKTERSSYAYLSGFFLGLALLTKYVSTILYIYFLLIIFLGFIFSRSEEKPDTYFKRSLMDYLKMFFASFATVFLLYPATWIKLEILLKKTLWSRPFEPIWKLFVAFTILLLIDTFLLKSRVLAAILNPLKKYGKYLMVALFSIFLLASAMAFSGTYMETAGWDFETMLASPKGEKSFSFSIMPNIQSVLAAIFVLLFELSPVVMLLLIFAILSSFRKNLLEKKDTLFVFFLLSFILIYYLSSAISNVESTVRYQISVLPIAAIIASVGLYRFMGWAFAEKFIHGHKMIFFVLFAVILSSSLILIKPFYFSYASFLLPKSQVLNVKDMGDGSYEMAQYLNSLPNAKNSTIWADKVAVCEYFAGNCRVLMQPDAVSDPNVSHFAISRGRTDKSVYFAFDRLPKSKAQYFRKIYSSEIEPEFQIEIGGRPNNFVRVVKNEIPSE